MWLRNKLQILFLLLFPSLYFIAGAYFRSLLGDLSLRTIDPDYVYFSNGLGISLGCFDTGNIFHPGSPLQYFVAVVFRMVYLFRSPEATYLEDVFSNPDLYMSAVSYSVTVAVSLSLLVSGYFVFKITKSTFYGILVQSTPFLPIIWYDLIGRLTPEVFQAFAVLALIVVVVKFYWARTSVSSISVIFLLSFISAFGLSVKVTFFPLLVIPFLMIAGWKKRIIFLAITLLLFLLLSLSVLLKIEVFWSWIKNIFLHSGDYGGGAETILDFSAFKSNLISLVILEKFYFRLVFISFLILMAYLIIFRKRADKRTVVYSFSIIVAIVIQLLAVSKHFAHRNFIPSLLLLPLLIFFSVEILKLMSTHQFYRLSVQALLLVFFALFIKNQLYWLPIKSKAMGNDIKAREETRDFISCLEKQSVKIITSQDFGSPFKEYALMYSTVWTTGKLKPRYTAILAKLYPDSYQHTTWDDRFQYWGSNFSVQQIIDSGKPVYLYIEKDDPNLLNRTLNKLKDVDKSSFEVQSEFLYKNEVTTEVVYLLSFSASSEFVPEKNKNN